MAFIRHHISIECEVYRQAVKFFTLDSKKQTNINHGKGSKGSYGDSRKMDRFTKESEERGKEREIIRGTMNERELSTQKTGDDSRIHCN